MTHAKFYGQNLGHGDVEAVFDPNDAASPETETFLRSNPVTAVPTYVSDVTRGAPQNTLQDELIDLTFQRPEELGAGPEDSQDLPLGSFTNPFGDPDKPGSQAFGMGLVGTVILVLGGFLLLSSVAEGIGEGLAQ